MRFELDTALQFSIGASPGSYNRLARIAVGREPRLTGFHRPAVADPRAFHPVRQEGWAQRLSKLRGKKRATVALARRIGVVLHRMWRDGTEFQFTREDAMALRTAQAQLHPIGRQQGEEERAALEGERPTCVPAPGRGSR